MPRGRAAGRAPAASARPRCTAASGTAPGHQAAHGTASRRVSCSNSECIATSVVVSQKNPTCLTSTKPARPHRIPTLKHSPAAWTMRASRHNAAARAGAAAIHQAAPPWRVPLAGQPAGEFPYQRLHGAEAVGRPPPHQPGDGREHQDQPLPADQDGEKQRDMHAAARPVHQSEHRGDPRQKHRQRQGRADHRQRGGEFPARQTTTAPPRATPAIPPAGRPPPQRGWPQAPRPGPPAACGWRRRFHSRNRSGLPRSTAAGPSPWRGFQRVSPRMTMRFTPGRRFRNRKSPQIRRFADF